MNVFYPEVEEDTDLLVSPTATGVEFFDQLRSEDSPKTLRFRVQMPEGAELRSDATGAEVVAGDGSRLAEVPPPNAVDSQGTEVPVKMSAEGGSLVIDVEMGEGSPTRSLSTRSFKNGIGRIGTKATTCKRSQTGRGIGTRAKERLPPTSTAAPPASTPAGVRTVVSTWTPRTATCQPTSGVSGPIRLRTPKPT